MIIKIYLDNRLFDVEVIDPELGYILFKCMDDDLPYFLNSFKKGTVYRKVFLNIENQYSSISKTSITDIRTGNIISIVLDDFVTDCPESALCFRKLSVQNILK